MNIIQKGIQIVFEYMLLRWGNYVWFNFSQSVVWLVLVADILFTLGIQMVAGENGAKIVQVIGSIVFLLTILGQFYLWIFGVNAPILK